MKTLSKAVYVLLAPVRVLEWLLERALGEPDADRPVTFETATRQRDAVQDQLERSKNITTGT